MKLNDIVRNFSKENAISSISQMAAILNLCSNAGIEFSYDVNYEEAFESFTANKFPEWNAEDINREIESLLNQGQYAEAALRRDKSLSLKNEIHRKFRLEKYGSEDWFMEKSESEIFFLPTKNEVIDSLVPGYKL